MEIKQKMELRKLLVPELTQSLNILAMPVLDIKELIESELESNPLLEELEPAAKEALPSATDPVSLLPSFSYRLKPRSEDLEFSAGLLTKKPSLQDVLLRQLGIFTNTDEDFRIGQEIIGNIDENGYLKATLEEVASALNVNLDSVEKVLKIVQKFDPPGVGARTISECLLIQLGLFGEKDPLLNKIVEFHLEDVARKNYGLIAKKLKEPREKIEHLIKRILRLDPKPGRNYTADEIQHVVPDIIIDEKDDGIVISINNEDLSILSINKTYQDMLKDDTLNPQTKEFLRTKLKNALEFLKAISKRQNTLRKVIEAVVEIQGEAIRKDLSHLKPLTFHEVASRINMHESTVCRAVMNKYVQLPYGVVALKDFFASHVHGQDGTSVSSVYAKRLLKDLIDKEDKKRPLSDQEIRNAISKEANLNISRRTVSKYREELKILSSTFRKER